MSRPSKHIVWSELACHDAAKTPYPDKWRATRLPRLARVFEYFRHEVCAPIDIGCAYRTPEHNRRVGGVKKSQHLQGRALDLHTPTGWKTSEFHALAQYLAQKNQNIGAIGYYRWGVHVDTRPRPRGQKLIAWGSTTAAIRV